MEAIRYDTYGDSDVLKIVEVGAPLAGPGQIRITMQAAGVNPLDWKLRAGKMKDYFAVSFPSGVGSEAAGIVDEVGEGVSGVEIGDAVFCLTVRNTAVAEKAVLTSWARKPDGMPFDVAGAISIVAETAIRILDLVCIKSGETLVVAGAAGGVGSAVVQLAHQRGVTVIGVASESKHEYLRKLGAIATTYGPDLPQRVHELAPQGVDAALDLAGAGAIPDLLEIVSDPARVLSIVDINAPKYGAQLTMAQSEHPEIALSNIAQLYITDAFNLHIEHAFTFAQVAQAQDLSATGRVAGKLVITFV